MVNKTLSARVKILHGHSAEPGGRGLTRANARGNTWSSKVQARDPCALPPSSGEASSPTHPWRPAPFPPPPPLRHQGARAFPVHEEASGDAGARPMKLQEDLAF